MLSGGPVAPIPKREYNGLRGENRGPFKGQPTSASNPVMTPSELNEKVKAIQSAAFFHVARNAAQHVYSSWTLITEEQDKIAVLEAKFEQFCAHKNNVTISRYVFDSRTQGSAESFAFFLTALPVLIEQYGSLEEGLLSDRIVYGTANTKVMGKLLSNSDLTLKLATDTCIATEASDN